MKHTWPREDNNMGQTADTSSTPSITLDYVAMANAFKGVLPSADDIGAAVAKSVPTADSIASAVVKAMAAQKEKEAKEAKWYQHPVAQGAALVAGVVIASEAVSYAKSKMAS